MRIEELRFEALGSACQVLGVGLDRGRLGWAAAWVAERHERFTRFEASSELARFNGGAGRWVAVSPELEALLRAALDAYRASGGLVHAGVLGSMLAIGYTRPLRLGPTAAARAGAPPPVPLPELLQVEPGRARLRPGAGIDLGGIAKGWLADRLAAELGENCLVNLGGDLFARGPGPAGDGWPVGLGGATLLLRDQGAATSGVWRRAWRLDGERLHHLIDPRTGRPAATDLAEVSVVAATATEAEVHAKTALLLGAAEAPGYLAGRALAWCLVQGGAGPPFRNPPSASDVGGASPPHEIRTPPPRFRGDPGSGASLRDSLPGPRSREDALIRSGRALADGHPLSWLGRRGGTGR
jgi:FAD:protein FMN transferase